MAGGGGLHDTALKRGQQKMKIVQVCMCMYVHPPEQVSPKAFKQATELGFHSFTIILATGLWYLFCKGRQNSLSIVNPNLFHFCQCFAFKSCKSCLSYYWVCVHVYESMAFLYRPESRIKLWPFEIISFKKWSNFFLMTCSGRPDYHKSTNMFETAVQGLWPKLSGCYHKTLH